MLNFTLKIIFLISGSPESSVSFNFFNCFTHQLGSLSLGFLIFKSSLVNNLFLISVSVLNALESDFICYLALYFTSILSKLKKGFIVLS